MNEHIQPSYDTILKTRTSLLTNENKNVITQREGKKKFNSYRATLKRSIILGPLYVGVWNRALNFAW